MPAPVFQQQFDQRAAVAAARGTDVPVHAASTQKVKDGGGFSFADFLDIINPLQHIPIISTLYRKLTGDTIKPLERLAGDTLYGGLWGAVSSFANLAFEQITGKDIGDTALALVTGEGKAPATALAAAAPSQLLATSAPRRLSALAGTGQTSGLFSVDVPVSARETRFLPSDLPLRALSAYARSMNAARPDDGASLAFV